MKFPINWICWVTTSLKGYFFKVVFWSIWIWFSDVWFFWPHSWHVYNKCEPKSKLFVIFKMYRVEMCLSLLKISIPPFNFFLTLDYSLVHHKCSSKSILRYLADWADISRFPCSLNLIEGSILRLVRRNIISSVFWVFSHNLLVLN